MNRTTDLVGGVLAITGCFGQPTDSQSNTKSRLPTDETPDDGYPPTFEQTQEQRDDNPSSFKTVDQNGVAVPLVPIDIAYYWYNRRSSFRNLASPATKPLRILLTIGCDGSTVIRIDIIRGQQITFISLT